MYDIKKIYPEVPNGVLMATKENSKEKQEQICFNNKIDLVVGYDKASMSQLSRI